MPHHNLIHILGMSGGFHGIWFDMEHVGFSSQELEILTMAAREHGLDTFCRVAPTDYATVTRCLEAGSSGIMAAQIPPELQPGFITWMYPLLGDDDLRRSRNCGKPGRDAG